MSSSFWSVGCLTSELFFGGVLSFIGSGCLFSTSVFSTVNDSQSVGGSSDHVVIALLVSNTFYSVWGVRPICSLGPWKFVFSCHLEYWKNLKCGYYVLYFPVLSLFFSVMLIGVSSGSLTMASSKVYEILKLRNDFCYRIHNSLCIIGSEAFDNMV